jgi:hypothetical protein
MSTTEEKRTAVSKAEVDEAKSLAKEVGLEYVDLDRYPLNSAASALIPEQIARRHHALAFSRWTTYARLSDGTSTPSSPRTPR